MPELDRSVDIIYCSHVLEHLSLEDFRKAIKEVYRILKPGGTFRGVLPDLEIEAKKYLADHSVNACSKFLETTDLGIPMRISGIGGLVRLFLGNSRHLWMWDFKGLNQELSNVGFNNIRRAQFGDSENHKFIEVEDLTRWKDCLGFECKKPID